jgi:hypothetical protein
MRFGPLDPAAPVLPDLLPLLLATVVRAAVGAPLLGVLLVVPLPLARLAAEPLASPSVKCLPTAGADPRCQG